MSKKSFVLIGPPGCGKSWVAKNIIMDAWGFRHAKYLSSDEIRGYVNGDEADQSNSEIVWGKIRGFYEACLYFKENIVFDATNYNKKSRKEFIERAKKAGYYITAVDCFTGLTKEEVVTRNQSRDRVVPIHVIDNMINFFQKPSFEEGFDDIIVVNQ